MKTFSDLGRETINNYRERERERERNTLPGGNEIPSSSSFQERTSEDKNVSEATNGFAERILTGALCEKTSIQQLTDHKNSFIPLIGHDDIDYARVSVYPNDKEYVTTGDGTLRVNASVKFRNMEQFMPLLDNNGFLQIVFKTTTRTRDFMRNIRHIDYEGYKRVEQIVRDPLYKDFHFSGKGAYKGRRGSKITPPFMTHSALAVVSETPSNGIIEPMCLLCIGNFHMEIELYPPVDNSHFIFIGDYYGQA